MQTKYPCVFIHIWIKNEVGAPLNRFKPSSKIFYWPFQGGTSFVDLLCFCSVLYLRCLCARLIIYALWSPAGKGLTSWLSFVVSNCEFVTFRLVSWVGSGTWLYRLLIFAPLLTFTFSHHTVFNIIMHNLLWALWEFIWYLASSMVFLLHDPLVCAITNVRVCLVKINAHNSWTTWYILIKFCKCIYCTNLCWAL